MTVDETSVPHEPESEAQVLGAVMQAPRKFDDVADRLAVEHFYQPRHQVIWQTLLDARSDGVPLEPQPLWVYYSEKTSSPQEWVAPYLHTLYSGVITIDGAMSLVSNLVELAQQRRLLMVGLNMVQQARSVGCDSDALMAYVRREFDLLAVNKPVDWQTPESLTEELLMMMTTPDTQDKRVLSSGHIALDRQLIGGFRAGQLIVVGGRPGTGKSMLGLDFVRHVAFNTVGVAALFSQEMEALEVGARAAAAQAQINLTRLQRGEVTDEELTRFTGSLERWNAGGMFIQDSTEMSVERISTSCRKLKADRGRLDLVVVDYCQLLRPEKREDVRAQQIAQITRDLKVLAGALKCPIVLLSQLNREGEKGGRKPRISDLRESGSLEQDASTVILLHADEVESGIFDSMTEVNVAKQRGGPLGPVWLERQGHYGRFTTAPN